MSNEIFIDGDANAVQLRVQGHTTQTNPLQTWEDSNANVLAQLDEDGQLLINGQQDNTHLRVQGHSTQSEAVQTWEKSDETVLAQITGDGRLELGDLDMGTPDALIEANNDITLPSTTPQRGVQSQGKITGNDPQAIDDATTWSVHELELLGDGEVSGLHTALRSKITQKNTGDADQAELRAGDFEAINESTNSTKPVGEVKGLQSKVTNEQGAYLTEAVGVEVAIADDNGATSQITNAYGLRIDNVPLGSGVAYAIHTGSGPVHLGDYLELVKPVSVPGQPAQDNVRVYPKSDGKLYAKDWQGTEYDLTGGNGGGGVPEHYRTRALMVRRIDNAKIAVLHGVVEVGDTEVAVDHTILDMGTAGDWLEGSSQEAANQMVYVYLDASGNMKLSNRAPIYPQDDTSSRVFTALANQSGWNGTSGNGLDATSVAYDGDSGETDLKAGMWLGICASDDTDYSKWRGAGSGSSGGESVPGQYAFLEAINTSTNTLTLRAGHNIAINDNDRLFAISGTPRYRQESSTWYRCIGALWNDGNQNLAEGTNGYSHYELAEGSDYTTSSTSFVAVDSTKLALMHVNFGEGVTVNFHGSGRNAQAQVYFDLEVDGLRLGGSTGIVRHGASQVTPISFTRLLSTLPPGLHAFKLMWRVNSVVGTLKAVTDSGQFSIKEG